MDDAGSRASRAVSWGRVASGLWSDGGPGVRKASYPHSGLAEFIHGVRLLLVTMKSAARGLT